MVGKYTVKTSSSNFTQNKKKSKQCVSTTVNLVGEFKMNNLRDNKNKFRQPSVLVINVLFCLCERARFYFTETILLASVSTWIFSLDSITASSGLWLIERHRLAWLFGRQPNRVVQPMMRQRIRSLLILSVQEESHKLGNTAKDTRFQVFLHVLCT